MCLCCSLVSKTSPGAQQDFKLLARSRINRVQCPSLYKSTVCAAWFNLCNFLRENVPVLRGCCTTMIRVSMTDSTVMLPQTAVFTFSPSVWKTSRCHSHECVCLLVYKHWWWWWRQGGCVLTGLWADAGQTGLQGGWMTGHSPQVVCVREKKLRSY